MILSARHGLVHPGHVLEPYDQSLTTAGAQERRNWAARVLGDLEELAGRFTGVYKIHAGEAYRDYGLIEGLLAAGAHVVVPAAGLSQGGQLALYSTGPGTGPRAA